MAALATLAVAVSAPSLPSAAAPVSIVADEPFLSLLGLVTAMIGYLIVTISLLVGMTALRKRGSALVVGGLAIYVLL